MVPRSGAMSIHAKRRSIARQRLVCCLVAAGACAYSLARAEPPEIQRTCVDARATGYGTFQSHNQKVVRRGDTTYMTHIRTRNEKYTAQQWRISKSTDGGRHFETVYEATHATNPPVLEVDQSGTLYLVRPDFLDHNAYLYRFLPSEPFDRPAVDTIPSGAAGKYSMVLDSVRRRIDYLAHNGRFYRLTLDGKVESSTLLLRSGKHAVLQYPLTFLSDDGRLHVAWTTQKHGVYLYWDIHYICSPDGGRSWQTMSGRRLTPPIVADDTGPTNRITLDDEFESHTWLSSFCVVGDKAHFLYLAQTKPARQHYVRYDLRSGRRDIDRQPVFRGDTIRLQGLDGFFVVDRKHPGTIYCVGRDAEQPRIACLVSRDNGQTWHDVGVSEPVSNPYSIGGFRYVTDDRQIIGSFTDQIAPTTDPGGGSKVFFFSIDVRP